MKKKWTVFDIVLTIFMAFVIVVTLYPFLNILAISLNDAVDTARGGIHIWPREFTLANYQEIFGSNDLLFQAFLMSIIRTVVGTITGIIASTMLAYTLSRKDFVLNGFVGLLLVLTMFISGGLIPEYMLIRNLGLINDFSVYILPMLLTAFNVIVIRSFMDNLPVALEESAKIDGANDFVIFSKIIIPLCMPVIATIALFLAVAQWNSWFDTYLYARGNEALTTLQFELMKILDNANISSGDINSQNAEVIAGKTNPQSIKMAITIIATVPILLVYPFLQKYFVTGLTLGAVKS
ncbi:putative aldouronate transport system permease protein [Gracilibacillus ureilyticus]|uniref:Putative aldouronate transport system permease protein n=1 Tax=Gracilibacillus ureilyticus TaxID=531814 RepID=A0A1H9PTJ3_9BACI|nr:carbohydrate ABC transporter permease [Gracilibacillus ureilyticus]SER51440.1 putative aldouronate transport system permease protein [Gracilibacillus ureilyticus]